MVLTQQKMSCNLTSGERNWPSGVLSVTAVMAGGEFKFLRTLTIVKLRTLQHPSDVIFSNKNTYK